MNKLDVIQLFEKCFNFYPSTRFEPTEDIIDDWHSILKDYPNDLVIYNLMEHVKKEKWFPSPSELIKPLPKLSYHESLKRDTQIFLNSPMVTEKKGTKCPPEIKEKLRKIYEKGE